MNRVLKYTRVTVSIIALIVITMGLVCDSETMEALSDRLIKIQIFPATMTVAIGVLALWVSLTLLFGRLYCSSVCPMGTLQDIIARLNRSLSRDTIPYRYSHAKNTTRLVTLIVVAISVTAGLTAIPALLDPYALYERFATGIIRPIYGLGRIAVSSVSGVIIALVPIVAISAVASRHGRTFCNTLCPVGTALGAISRNSLLHIDINTDKCIHCRKCEQVCKASCIDLSDHVVDGSRCVTCFNCTDVCPNSAITYTTRRHRLSTPMMQRIKESVTPDSPQPVMDFDNPQQTKHNDITRNNTSTT
ncbi:MAG: 4Fe-4S binding protein [Muribaculaceae bacterium]|nr:4Fe-4S binding protein [Muribaculaceae bacterium]